MIEHQLATDGWTDGQTKIHRAAVHIAYSIAPRNTKLQILLKFQTMLLIKSILN